jgi:serine/threonine protein kinase
MLQLLSDLPNIPAGCGPVEVDGKVCPTAAAHEYVSGRPLSWFTTVDERLFVTLRQTLAVLHQRNIAYVDLHKLENIIVDEQGNPHLIDFQISVRLVRRFPVSLLLNILQKSDLYHLDKHIIRFGPDPEAPVDRPWWIRAHRLLAVPFRTARRRFLTVIGVRKQGRANSEQFVEEGLSRKPVLERSSGRQAA